MRIITGDRQTGKTTALIEALAVASEERGGRALILCPTVQHSRAADQLIIGLGRFVVMSKLWTQAGELHGYNFVAVGADEPTHGWPEGARRARLDVQWLTIWTPGPLSVADTVPVATSLLEAQP